ncbi:MAG: bifunctional ADP-dependent NAD(P)H-hydrate dehydratase/NAD(P)H-hydrate epimerase, partial [Atopobiaceae bacterium]|nr:bifunctional ADP-dependent NAD(P)H-hydrate dehydratase/NAD(P)H-hydrate epimerase [Atopobiaceae bacterium]
STAPASLAEQLAAARRIIWSNGGSELAIVAKGSATGCVGVEQAILPKPGPAALATAGSGDVLGGIIASLLAQKSGTVGNLPLLCALACEIHGYAGSVAAERYGSRGVMATDIIDVLGLAADTIEEHCYYPDALAQDAE